jgi:hypothetical protein
MKAPVLKKSAVIAAFIALLAVAHNGCINDPVDDDYFLDINKVHGKNKPAPVPVIDTLTWDGARIIVDFTSTSTIDPESGVEDNLFYLLYWSSGDPANFADESLYYDELYYLGYVAHADLGGVKKVNVNPGSYRGRIYFWMTAHDGGRESDHSMAKYIDI